MSGKVPQSLPLGYEIHNTRRPLVPHVDFQWGIEDKKSSQLYLHVLVIDYEIENNTWMEHNAMKGLRRLNTDASDTTALNYDHRLLLTYPTDL